MIANICGNGHTVHYDPSLDGNSALRGLTYSLANGGKLTPKNSIPEFSMWAILGAIATATIMSLLGIPQQPSSATGDGNEAR